MKIISRVFMASVLITCFFSPVHAQTAGESQLEEQAILIMHKMADFYGDAYSFSVENTTTVNMVSTGFKQQMQSTYELAVERPDKIAILHKGGLPGASVASNKTTLTVYNPYLNTYIEKASPGSVEAVLRDTDVSMAIAGAISLNFTSLLAKDNPYEEIMEGVTSAEYKGLDEIDGIMCHHLEFSQSDFSWELWVESGPAPYIRKLRSDMSAFMKQNMQQGGMVSRQEDVIMVMVAGYKDWAVNEDMPDEKFSLDIPASAQKTDSLFSNPQAQAAQQEQPSLIDKPAPDFKLSSLSGDEIILSSYMGEKVIILDFWASWCGPCRKALPVVAELAEEYKDQDVMLIAVNQAEEKHVIINFLQENNLDITVVLDSDRSVAEKYQVSGIPQTVIIDYEGKIKAVHVGYTPDIKASLKEDIRKILRGRCVTE